MCGGTPTQRSVTAMYAGLSPRVRGNRYNARAVQARIRSIPACAGEPRWVFSVCMLTRVYPRVCGGTWAIDTAYVGSIGLSPRVRGNLTGYPAVKETERSIPACAGEPLPPESLPAPTRVYPRVCGGTSNPFPNPGLSPRVRGNPLPPRVRALSSRSIPACAGEPASTAFHSIQGRVYPRVCGGTNAGVSGPGSCHGLSPRVRGNPSPAIRTRSCAWSIPACAGEPPLPAAAGSTNGVYPRVCGGTQAAKRGEWARCGLSPRVRGNRAGEEKPRPDEGSIPACAGEPGDRRPQASGERVYPRVCGGTV